LSNINRNLIANYAGKVWAAIINIAFVPLYIKYMGIEAYGLVGIFATIQPLMTILDLGLSPSINRELARYSATPGHEKQMRNLVRTLEVLYWGIAAVLCVGVLLLSPLVASKWVHAQLLPVDTIKHAVILMGLSIVIQWPVGFYTGGLMGLQRQVLFNVTNTIIWTLRGVGALVVVMISSDPVLGFFWWQLIMSIVNVGVVAVIMWRALPASRIDSAKFSFDVLRSVWRLAIGMGAVSVVILIFNQLDKIILSKQITLTDFGYYSLAWQVVGSLFMLYYPIYSAFFPVMTQLIAQGDLDSFKEVYHKGSQFMSVAVLPASVIIALFSSDILLIWVRNPTTVANCSFLLSILIVGAAFNGMLCIQYAVSQAFGQTRHMLYVYVITVIVYIPIMLIVTKNYGVLGAAIAFSGISIIQDYIIISIIHAQFIPREHVKWLAYDLGRPLLISLLVGILLKYLVSWPIIGLVGIVTILICYALTLFAASMVTPATNRIIRRYASI
jgi:O-antigen/teichoic acid export membrane protein